MINLKPIDAFQNNGEQQVAYRQSQSRIDAMNRKYSKDSISEWEDRTWEERMDADDKRDSKLTKEDYRKLVGSFVF